MEQCRVIEARRRRRIQPLFVEESSNETSFIQKIVRKVLQKMFPLTPTQWMIQQGLEPISRVFPTDKPRSRRFVPTRNPARAVRNTVHESDYPSPSLRKTDLWRTPQNKPICFYCGRPGHVAKHCFPVGGAVGTIFPKKGPAHDSLMIQVLLDVCCSFIEPNDPAKKNQLYELLNENLCEDKVLRYSGNLRDMNSIRQHASGWFINYLQKFQMGTNMTRPVYAAVSSVPVPNFFSTKIYPNTYDQNFEQVEVIATGGFGTVCKAVHKIDGITYAVKKIIYSIDKEKEATKVLSEVRSIATLSHVNIVSYKNCWVQLVNNDVDDESSLSSSYASRQTDIDCSTPCSAVPMVFGRRGMETPLLQQAVSNASSDATDLSSQPHLSPKPVKKGLWTSTITEASSDSSCSDGMEDANACLDQLDDLPSMSFPDDPLSDSIVQFDYGNKLPALDSSSSSTVTFLSEGEDAERSEIVPRDCSTGRKTPFRERLKAMLCIQMEYCDYDLSKWLEVRAAGKEELPFQKDVRDIFRDIVRGVVHIHSKSIIHRDLKPSNIFYSERDSCMKIGDFGLATMSKSIAKQPEADISVPHTSNLGTQPYMAPEQKIRRDYDEKVDIYSLGIILLELLVPCSTRTQLQKTVTAVVKRGELPSELTKNHPPQYGDLVKNLLQEDPQLRMSAKEILEHPLLQDTAQVEKRQLLLQIRSLKMTLERRERELEEARKEIAELKTQLASRRCH